MASVVVTLTAVNSSTGACTFTMKRGTEATITQVVDGLPVANDGTQTAAQVQQAFVQAATKYATGYYAGQDAQTAKVPVVDAAITALVGQNKTITV